MPKKTKRYYKAKYHYDISNYPYTIPRGSLLTQAEISRYRLDEVLDIQRAFYPVDISPSKTEKLWYAFRFEK